MENVEGDTMRIQLTDKIKLIHFRPDHNWQHVILTNTEDCRQCQDKACLSLCPSGVFVQDCDEVDHILVLYKQCVECGACRLICKNIEFFYPRGGFGVAFKEG